MARWVKFSDRLPTEADADSEGELFMQHEDGTRSITCMEFTEEEPDQCVEDYAGWFWLENVPEPRTLDDTIRELLRYIGRTHVSLPDYCDDLLNEIRGYLGDKDNE